MKRSYKWLIFLIAVAIALTCFAGCDKQPGATTTETGEGSGNDTSDETLPTEGNEKELVELPDVKYNDEIVFGFVNDGWYLKDVLIEDEETENVVEKAVYMRNTAICDIYGIEITVVRSEDSEGVNPFMSVIQSGSDEYDILAPAGTAGIKYAINGLTVDWNTQPVLNTTYAWWNQSARECFTINGKLFFMSGDLSHGATASSYAILANKDRIEANGLTVPYEDVANGTWTFEKMEQIALQCAEDLNSNGSYELGTDVVGFSAFGGAIYAPFYASGSMVYSKDDTDLCVITMATETAYNAMDKYFTFVNNDKCDLTLPYATSEQAKGIYAGNFIFFNNTVQFFAQCFSDADYDYSILPFPKMDDQQKGYTSHMAGSCPVYLIPNTVSDPERSAVILEALSQDGHTRVIPTYFDEVVSLRTMKTEENYEMLQIINQARIYDLGYFTGTGAKLLAFLATEGSANKFFSQYETIAAAEESFLLEIYDAYAD